MFIIKYVSQRIIKIFIEYPLIIFLALRLSQYFHIVFGRRRTSNASNRVVSKNEYKNNGAEHLAF